MVELIPHMLEVLSSILSITKGWGSLESEAEKERWTGGPNIHPLVSQVTDTLKGSFSTLLAWAPLCQPQELVPEAGPWAQ